MGVRALQSYLEKYCQSAIPIKSIQELAESRRNSTDQELIIVVDGLNIIQRIYYICGYLPSVGGGQFKEYSGLIKLFVEAFQQIGIRLVFFFDGTTVAEKRKTWVERRMANMEKQYQFLDMLKDGTVALGSVYVMSPGIFCQTRFILEEEYNCEVYESIFDCDEEIADYARRKDAFGVLAHDSDFVIFDIGRAFYIDTDHLDLETMKTRVYYPDVLVQTLGLNKSQLPLLATLMGNDFVQYNELGRFHYKLSQKKSRDVKYLVPKIATYIKSLDVDFHNNNKVYRKVAQNVFGNSFHRYADIKRSVLSYISCKISEDEKCETPIFFEKREPGIYSAVGSDYDIWKGRSEGSGENWSGSSMREDKCKWEEKKSNWRENQRKIWQEGNTKDLEGEEWLQLVREARQLFRHKKIPNTIYVIMKDQLSENCSLMEDYRIVPRDLPIFSELTLEIRQRLYGVLLHQKPVRPGSHRVEEWFMAGPGSLERASHVSAVAPSAVHPGLLALWGEEDRPKGRLSDIRWSLLVHSISSRLDVQSVRVLPQHMVMPTLILHYILNYQGPGRLEGWEVEVFLATAAVLHHYRAEDLHAIPENLTYRGVRVSNIVMLTGGLFDDLIAACGYPLSVRQTAPCNYFDGKLFQVKYQEAKESRVSHAQLCDNKDDSLLAFQKARSVIFDECENRKELESG